MSDDELQPKSSVSKRLSMNTRLSAARIFDEDSNDSVSSKNSKPTGKIKSQKKDNKASPYKNDRPTRFKKFEKIKIEYETDEAVLERRQKQIDYGKNTVGYDNYIKLIPKNERTLEHPKTPVKYLKYSRRGFDGLIKAWRHKLHEFDPEDAAGKSKPESNDEEENFEEEEVTKVMDDYDKNSFIDFI